MNQKLDPGDPYCDLEHNARELAREITDQQQTLQTDLRSIDQQLLILARRFQEAVEKGYKTAAFVSMEGLMYGIHNIRKRVQQNDLTFCRQYVKANANYLKEWARLTDLAKGLDLLRENLERHKENYCLAEEEVKKRIDDLQTELKTNAHKRKLFEELYYQEKSGESLSCSNEGRELYDALIELRLKQINLDLQDCVINQEENRLNSQKGQVTRLREKLNGLPIVQSPNQLNAFQEAMEEMVREMAQLDAEIDETLSAMDKIDAHLLQMQIAEGDASVMEAVLQQTEEVLKRFREEEEMLQGAGGTEQVVLELHKHSPNRDDTTLNNLK